MEDINCAEKLVKHITEFVNGIFVHLMIFFQVLSSSYMYCKQLFLRNISNA